MEKSKKMSKKILALLLAVTCVFAFMPLLSNANAASSTSKLKVAGSSAVKAGKTITLKAKTSPKANAKDTKWKSSNKNVAKVLKCKGAKIKVKGLKKGTVKITATNGGKKVVKKIKVKGLKITKATLNKTTGVKVGDTLKVTLTPAAAQKKALYVWYVNGVAPNDQDFDATWEVTPAMQGKTIKCEVNGAGYYSGSSITTVTTNAVLAK